MNAPALSERRIEAETRLARLQRERGAAMVDGGPVDHQAIAEVEAQLAALTEAEGIVTNRERAAAAEAERERQERLRAQVANSNIERLAAIRDAEVAARTMVAAFKRAFAAIDTMSAAATAIPQRLDDRLSKPETGRRLSYRLSNLLKGLTHPGSFGAIELRVGPFPPDPNTPWTDGEQIEPLLIGEKH
jgi:hypothetical protein